ncbi:hypothetical protein Ancab_009610 [Ancistrocladus abbreviatus]
MFQFFKSKRRNRAEEDGLLINSAVKDPISSNISAGKVLEELPAKETDNASGKRRRLEILEVRASPMDRWRDSCRVADTQAKATTSGAKRIRVKSSDGQTFEVEEMVAMESEVMRSASDEEELIKVPNISGRILAIVIDYCRKRVAEDCSVDDLEGEEEEEHDDDQKRRRRESEWAAHLFTLDQSAFFDVSLAAYHLKIKSLLDLTSQTVAGIIKGKSLTEIRQIFSMEEDPMPTTLTTGGIDAQVANGISTIK